MRDPNFPQVLVTTLVKDHTVFTNHQEHHCTSFSQHVSTRTESKMVHNTHIIPLHRTNSRPTFAGFDLRPEQIIFNLSWFGATWVMSISNLTIEEPDHILVHWMRSPSLAVNDLGSLQNCSTSHQWAFAQAPPSGSE